jgi:hypothetical protein
VTESQGLIGSSEALWRVRFTYQVVSLDRR